MPIRLFAGLVALLSAGPVAADSRSAELAALAKEIKKFADDTGFKKVAVGGYVARPEKGDSYQAGPGLSNELSQQLALAGLTVDREADYLVRGEYWSAKDRDKRPLIQIHTTVEDTRSRKELIKFKRDMYGPAVVAAVQGTTVCFKPGNTPRENERLVRERDDKPAADVKGAKVGAEPDSPYRVELLVKRGGKYEPVKPDVVDGKPQYDLKKSDVYAIKIINDSEYEAAAEISIDGLNVFAFCTLTQDDKGLPLPGLKPTFIVESKKNWPVQGWPLDDKKSDQFLVCEYPKSAAKLAGVGEANLGMVVVKFSPCWEAGKKPKVFEAYTKDDLGTGRGLRIDTPAVRLEREFGDPLAIVVLRYTR